MDQNRPRFALSVIAAYALLQTTRLVALSIISSVLSGTDDSAWLYPAIVDVVLGVSAPLVAFALWRRTGLWVWVGVIVWFAISIFDHADGITAALISPIPTAFGGGQAMTIAGFVVLALLDLGALIWLGSRRIRSYLWGSVDQVRSG